MPPSRRRIVQMSSVGGVIGNPGHAAYATSTFALEGLSEALAGEVAPFGVKVLIVEPGPFRTDFAGRSMRYTTPSPAYEGTPAGLLRAAFSDQDQVQPNDPRRAAEIIRACLRIPTPRCAYRWARRRSTDRIRTTLARQAEEIDRWELLARDTRFR